MGTYAPEVAAARVVFAAVLLMTHDAEDEHDYETAAEELGLDEGGALLQAWVLGGEKPPMEVIRQAFSEARDILLGLTRYGETAFRNDPTYEPLEGLQDLLDDELPPGAVA